MGGRRLSGIGGRLDGRAIGATELPGITVGEAMADVRIIATGLRFPEGPLAMADGSVILGEIAGGTVTRVASDGSKSTVNAAGGGPNGLARGPDGALYLCNNGGAEYASGNFLATGPAKNYSAAMFSGSIRAPVKCVFSIASAAVTNCPPRMTLSLTARAGSTSPISASGAGATATMAGSTTPCRTARK